MVGILSRTKPATKQSMSKPGITATNLCGIVDIHCAAGQIRDEQMAHHAHRRGSNNLVELKTEKRFEPSPEEKISFVEDHPRDEYRSEEANDRCADCAVGDDYANQSGQNAQDDLHRVGANKQVRLGE